MKRICITGHKGYIGTELLKRGFLPLDVDITDIVAFQQAIKYAKPELVIHLGGKTSVDFCEDKKNEVVVRSVNVMGAGNVFRSLAGARIPGVFLSSDHVFHGGMFETHREDATPYSKQFLPVNFYGMCKLATEQAAHVYGINIIRTSVLFDSKRLQGDLFAINIGNKTQYPTFIKRSFLHLYDFCDMVEKYCNNFYRMPKLLHLSGSRVVSWHTFAKEIAKQYGYKSPKPRYFEDKSFTVPRPRNGGLDTKLSHLVGFPHVDYASGIERMKREN